MNKKMFLQELSRYLYRIPQNERVDILADYEDHFSAGLEAGKTEEEIAASLGNPESIAKNFNADYVLKEADENRTAGNIFRAVIAIISLGFFNLVFVLGPFIGLLGVLFAFIVTGFAISAAGIGVFLASILSPALPTIVDMSLHPLVAAFTGIGLTSLGLLILIGDYFLAKLFYSATISYLKLNIKIINR